MSRVKAHAKINLALVVGALREGGKHEVVTLLQRIELHDDLSLEPSDELGIEGFADDTLVRAALTALGKHAGAEPSWRVTLGKSLPVAAGLGGGSADAAAALLLANAELAEPLPLGELHTIASEIGSDVPFFLREGAQLPRESCGGTALFTAILARAGVRRWRQRLVRWCGAASRQRSS